MKFASTFVRAAIAAVVLFISWGIASTAWVDQVVVVRKKHPPRVQPKGAWPPGAPPASISKEWQTIFVLVLGYYFSTRPMAVVVRDRGESASQDDRLAAKQEAVAQSLLTAALVVSTVVLFASTVEAKVEPSCTDCSYFRDAVDGSWIAGVMLAVVFSFKEKGSKTTLLTKTGEEALPRAV